MWARLLTLEETLTAHMLLAAEINLEAAKTRIEEIDARQLCKINDCACKTAFATVLNTVLLLCQLQDKAATTT